MPQLNRDQELVVDAFAELIRRYDRKYDRNGILDDTGPVLFVREMLLGEPDAKQAEILRAICRGERQISVRSGHGVGKTTTLAWAIIWHMFVKRKQKTVCTAPTKGQLFDALRAETESWINRLPDELRTIYDVKSESIHHAGAPSDSFCTFATSRAEQPEALAGKHSDWVLLIADEASGIPEAVFEAASGSMSGENAVMVLTGNPVRSSGLFFDTHNKRGVMENWYKVHISCVGHPRITQKYIDEQAARYGEDSNAFRVRVLGEFPKADDDTIIPYELAEAARLREIAINPTATVVWGLDCARFGDDSTALAKRKGKVLLQHVQEWKGLDTMQVVGRVMAEWNATPKAERPVAINVDVIGIGAGVADRLRELGLPARGINVSEAPALDVIPDAPKYFNLRTELWFMGRDWLSKRDCTLGGDEKLVADLVRLRFSFTSNGKAQAESKKDLKKRGYPSPNLADAFLLTFANDAITAQNGSAYGSSNWKEPLKRRVSGVV